MTQIGSREKTVDNVRQRNISYIDYQPVLLSIDGLTVKFKARIELKEEKSPTINVETEVAVVGCL